MNLGDALTQCQQAVETGLEFAPRLSSVLCQEEIAVLQPYLPAQLSDAELDALIAEAISSTGAASIKDMGKVMGVVKAKAAGKADMGAVGARIKAKLGG